MHPPTPQEVKEICAYFGIDCSREFYLLPLAITAIENELPPNWSERRDEANNRSVFIDPEGVVHACHPGDSAIKQKVGFTCLL
jgi:hypothetical protein